MSTATQEIYARPRGISFEGFRSGIVSAIFITSFYVKLEPAITDFLGLLALCLFFKSGLHFSRYLAAPILLLVIYVGSNIISCIPIDRPQFLVTNPNYLFYPLILAYTCLTGIFISAYVAGDPLVRYLQIERAYWIGGTLGAILGLMVYFGFSPAVLLVSSVGSGHDEYFSSRVLGGFKDPNVFSTWLLMPIVSMMQAMMTRRLKLGFLSFTSLITMIVALLLAFSRGAWADLALAALIMIILSILLTPSSGQRHRLMIAGVGAVGLALVLLLILLSDPALRQVFEMRLHLVQSYDAGETGRFGNQLNSIPLLLSLPFGFGPYQFNLLYGVAPHNTFINAFAAGGWSAGLAYILLCFTNLIFGMKAVFTRSPFQPFAIVVFSCLVAIILQGVQIDEEHWRHYFILMGLTWGLFAATMEYGASGFTATSILESWNVLPAQRLAATGRRRVGSQISP